ncbi:hypothetical protein MPTK1_6g00530 [Marchantia polymorpha subsp. ruderalis]|uniref:Uncharacterized protein n=2 Tax=Marchantia polymorpha TaxID=3197 RepID=A0AAF6BM34_MARPO|nr:hypothetical protein MARPO_0104s0013 [Marchantia polymorpha]BBN13068.1 hypothetical protein Mp_6g00530 [Marchantia polymorpha subsp. ruderalis]|eukprot:PTQ31977.1 hypothetical protein MARPO_0104s0013 [Marchantia polymorpha]
MTRVGTRSTIRDRDWRRIGNGVREKSNGSGLEGWPSFDRCLLVQTRQQRCRSNEQRGCSLLPDYSSLPFKTGLLLMVYSSRSSEAVVAQWKRQIRGGLLSTSFGYARPYVVTYFRCGLNLVCSSEYMTS